VYGINGNKLGCERSLSEEQQCQISEASEAGEDPIKKESVWRIAITIEGGTNYGAWEQ